MNIFLCVPLPSQPSSLFCSTFSCCYSTFFSSVFNFCAFPFYFIYFPILASSYNTTSFSVCIQHFSLISEQMNSLVIVEFCNSMGERPVSCSLLAGDSRSGDNSLVVSMELNGVTYQGVLFAQTSPSGSRTAMAS